LLKNIHKKRYFLFWPYFLVLFIPISKIVQI